MSPSKVTRDFTRRLPKVELHAHLTGSISRHCLHEIWERKKAQDPLLQLEDPITAIPPGKVDYDIKTFFPLFSSYIYKLCSDVASIEYSTRDVLKQFQLDGVVYLELRTTPRAIPQHHVSKDDYVRTVLAILEAHNQEQGNSMQVRLLLAVDRRNTVAEANEVVDLATKYQSAGVVGLDLCGDPTKGDVSIFTAAFHRAKAAGLNITLHFAEAPVSDEEVQTLLSWYPDRLGHVIHVKDEFKRVIEERNIGLELQLSCNVHAKLITGTYSDHHFGEWRHSRVPITLCTDDVGVFCSPLSEEYLLVHQHFGLDESDLKALAKRSVDSIFGGPAQQERLRRLYADFESTC